MSRKKITSNLNFGVELANLRKDKGLGQLEFAEKIGFSQGYISLVEEGKRIPSKKFIKAIENYCGDIAQTGESVADGDFIKVPRYEVRAHAGEGEVIHSEQVVDHLAFKRDWVKVELGLDAKNLVLISAVGDSMEPAIRPNDLLLLDISAKHVRNDGIYCFSENGDLKVKRMQKIGKDIVVISDNPKFKEYTLTPEKADSVRLVGRVVWIGRRV